MGNKRVLTEEEKHKRKLERIQARLQGEREERQKKRVKKAEREREKAREELKAMNNIKPVLSATNEKNKAKTESKGIGNVSISKRNRKGEQKRVERYNTIVWKEWRESDGVTSPVVTYKASGIEKKGDIGR